MAEADLNERITAAGSALLPLSHAEATSESPSDRVDAVMHAEMDVLESLAGPPSMHPWIDARRMRKR